MESVEIPQGLEKKIDYHRLTRFGRPVFGNDPFWKFITAGVPTVVVSLWPVSDQATAVLMGNYYKQMMAGTGKAPALRNAILETKKKFPAPSLWAPFVLYGLAE